ncbi:MAG: glycosyltransferase family A protein [Chthoniobacteraceae bacterium]
MPKTAVVIPLYNHEAYIGPALQSVLAQTRPVDRIIVIDDGSSDGSVAAARAVPDARIEVITQENIGAHNTLNRGVQMAADCEFTAILNSDDLYEPERIARCLAVLEKNEQVQVVCSRFEMIDPAGTPLDAENPKARWVRILWESRRSNPAEWMGLANFAKTTSNVVARTPWLLAHPFQPYRYVHDWFFFAATAVERKLAVLDTMLLKYRAHPTNTIKSGEPGAVTREVLQMNFDLLRELAPRLAAEPELRANYRAYLRVLLGNHTDFRGEVFIHLLAALVEQVPPTEMAGMIAGLGVEQFSELAAPSSKSLRSEVELKRLIRFHERSRWTALGRVFGVGVFAPQDDSSDAEKKLSAFKEALKANTWVKLGDALGQYRLTE